MLEKTNILKKLNINSLASPRFVFKKINLKIKFLKYNIKKKKLTLVFLGYTYSNILKQRSIEKRSLAQWVFSVEMTNINCNSLQVLFFLNKQ